MAEVTSTQEIQKRLSPSEVRPGAKLYELVGLKNTKTNQDKLILYWWDGKNQHSEPVDRGARLVNVSEERSVPAGSERKATEIVHNDLKRRISKNDKRVPWIKLERNILLTKEIIESTDTSPGALVPFFEEMLAERHANLEDARLNYEKIGKGLKRSSEDALYREKGRGPLLGRRSRKYEEDFNLAFYELESGFQLFNKYLNGIVEVDGSLEGYDVSYAKYLQLDEVFGASSDKEIEGAATFEDKVKLIKERESKFRERIEIFKELAKEKGIKIPSEIPEEFTVPKKISTPSPNEPLEPVREDEEVEKVVQPVAPMVVEKQEEFKKDKDLATQVVQSLQKKGEFKKELDEEELGQLFQFVLASHLSSRKKFEGDFNIKKIKISGDKLLVQEDVKGGSRRWGIWSRFNLAVNLDFVKSEETGKLLLSDVGVAEKGKSEGELSRVAQKAKEIILSNLSNPNESVQKGLNLALKARGTEVSGVELEIREGKLSLSATGGEV